MLYQARDLEDYTLRADDGDLGSVDDIFFEDGDWTIRYFVIDTGRWLPGRQVLISPKSADLPDPHDKVLPVRLTKEQVQNSPDIDTQKPISRQQELQLAQHYGWPVDWGPLGAYAPPPSPHVLEEESRIIVREQPDSNLRSAKEVRGYLIHAADGEIGTVHDMLFDQTWTIRYFVIDTGKILPGKKTIISPSWIDRIRWAERAVHVSLTRDEIRNSPELDTLEVGRDYEEQLYEHYQRRKYW